MVREGARVRASGTRHTFNPWLWGVESDVQPGTQVRVIRVTRVTRSHGVDRAITLTT